MEEEIIKTTVSPSQPEVVTEIPKKNPLVVILLVILGLLVVAGAVYAAFEMGKKQISPNVVTEPTIIPQTTEVSPAPDETANWQTYTNPVYHYSFKYPSTWKISFEDTYQYTNVTVKSPAEESVNVMKFTNSSKSEDKENWTKSISLDSSNYLLVAFSHCPGGPGKEDCGGAITKEEIIIFNQIISSFTGVSPTSSSRIYKNDLLNFTLSYPTSLEVLDKTARWLEIVKQTEIECQKNDGCGGGPKPKWVIDFVSAEDKQNNLNNGNLTFENRLFQFNLSVYENTTLEGLYGEKAPTGYEQTIVDFSLGGKMGLRNIQKSDPANPKSPYIFYGVENNGKTYSFMFPNKAATTQNFQEIEKMLSTFKFLK